MVLQSTSIQRQCGDAFITVSVGKEKTLLPRAIKPVLALSPATSVQSSLRELAKKSF